MRYSKLTVLIAASIILVAFVACSGDGFTPNPGPYNGQFYSSDLNAGTLSITASDRTFGGTGVLIHDGANVTVSIAGNVSGSSLSGTVSNALQGTGSFLGSFSGPSNCGGTFTYTDTLGLATTTGTWSAQIPST